MGKKFMGYNNASELITAIGNKIKAKYTKPSGGIPKSDLATAVQTSLGKADSALQSETDPTVPSWAKQTNKPSYTQDEVADGSTYKRVKQTEKNAWNEKQNALSTTQMQAVNSGITSEKVTQISTNQANISYAINTGVKNLLTITSTNETAGNLSFTHNSDGSVLVNTGSSGSHSNVFHTLHAEKIYLKTGTYVLSGCPSGGSGSSYELRLYSNSTGTFVECKGTPVEFTLSSDTWIDAVLIRIDATYNPSNMTFYPMICAKSVYDQDSSFMIGALPNSDLTYLEAEDRAALAEEIDAGAKNKLQNKATSKTQNNVTFTVNSDGEVTVSTTAQGSSSNTSLDLCGSYIANTFIGNIISGVASGSTSSSYCLYVAYSNDGSSEAKAIYVNAANNPTHQILNYPYIRVFVLVYSGQIISTPVKFQPMICTKAAFGVSQKFVPFGNDPFYQVPINHNMIYRGKNLGDTLTDAQHTALSSGNFTDLYLGDYWTKTVTIPAGTYTGGDGKEVTVRVQTNITLKAVIADFDTFYTGYASSYAGINTHHAAVIVTGFSNVVWNGTNSTAGGYVNSLIHKWLVGSVLPQIETWFGAAKVLSHQKLLTNAITGDAASGWDWSSQKISLLSENQMYGSKVWGNSKATNGVYEPGEAFKHLNVFNHIDANLLFGNKNIWLRDIASAERVAHMSSRGNASYDVASSSWIAPAALILLS